jgi:SAM-dependent methyltransferase
MPSLLRRVLAGTGLLEPVFRLREWQRALGGGAVPALGPDGLPLPRRIHMVRVVGHANWRQFYESGRIDAAFFAELAEAAGVPMGSARTVLDWGCGSGRVTRHLRSHTGAQILGRDLDPVTVGWAARNLPGDFKPCGLTPPLDLADGSVDIVTSLSVFTHLSRAGQMAWLAELARILRPGGLLLLTFMDETHLDAVHLGAARAGLEAEGFAVTTSALEGTNHMATFQTRDQLVAAATAFDAVLSRTSAETPMRQAAVALVRRS